MHFQRVACIYDNLVRRETTGTYCLPALKPLVEVVHFLPQDLERIPRSGFDLYLNIDDGLRYRLPSDLRPCAWWVIDTHMDPAWAEEKGRDFDWLFAAQKDGAERLQKAGLPATWLPLACDPEVHKKHAVKERWDISFIGRVSPGPRQELLELIQRTFPSSFVGQRYFDDFARAYSESRIGFNRSVKNDVNMRVFETLGCGTLFITNDLRENGQEELFEAGRHLVTYRGAEELVSKLRFYLNHECARDAIARAGHSEAVARHTYRHRMQSILNRVAGALCVPSGLELSVPAAQGEANVVGLNSSESTYGEGTTVPNATQDLPAMRMLDSIDFIIKTFLRPQALLRLLRSIGEYYPTAQVTIADDGNLRESPDVDSRSCIELIDANQRYRLHALPFAAGVTAGRNLLVDKTERPFLLLLDDDFCFTAETKIERFFDRLQADPKVGIVAGACIDVVGNERRPRNSGGTLTIEGATLVLDTKGWRDREAGLRDFVPQFALIRRDVFADVRWEGGIGAEHYDFCLQVQKSGWKVAHDLSVLVDHYHFTPALAGYAERRLDYAAAQQWLLRKWNLARIVQDGETIVARVEKAGQAPHETSVGKGNGQLAIQVRGDGASPASSTDGCVSRRNGADLPVKDGSYFEFARPEVVALVPHSARRVLDIGCGAGRLGELIKKRQTAEVVGIELQPEAAALARERLDDVLEQNVEDRALDFPAGRFDCVVCADVLEHLREPGPVLARIRRWLTPDGALVASLPNIRHHSVVASLLEGNFTYESAGLLDSDHVRFFTRREIEKLLFRQQFEIQTLQSKLGPGDDEYQKQGGAGKVRVGPLQIGGLTTQDAEDFFTYQYLVVARPCVKSACRLGPSGNSAVDSPEPADRLAKLARDFAWPDAKPDIPLPTANLGWFEPALGDMLRGELTAKTKLVVELGAWLGLSTRFIADNAPQARVISIDHWEGSPEHLRDPGCAAMLPTLYQTFLALNWEYRDRILPLKMTTQQGLKTIAAYGLQPDLIFIDAEHSYEAVSADLKLCRELFPRARIVGDDYDDPGVGRAVEEFAAGYELRVEPVGADWRAWRLVDCRNSGECSHEEGTRRVSATIQGDLRAGPLPIFESDGRPDQATARASGGVTSIIIVTYNELGYTKECIDSIRLRTDEPYELIFVDNGSTDGTVAYLQQLCRKFTGALGVPPASEEERGLQSATLITNAGNRGFPAAVNQGLAAAQSEFVLLLNNDTVVTTGWLRQLLETFEIDPRIGLAGPCSNSVSGAQLVPVAYKNITSLDGFAWEWGKRHQGVVEETQRLVGFCLMLRRTVLDQIGLLDERFGIGCYEDDDLCLRALLAGWKVVIARAAFVHHYGSRTFAGSGVDLRAMLRDNGEKFREKWRGAARGGSHSPQEQRKLACPSGVAALGCPTRVNGDTALAYGARSRFTVASSSGGLRLAPNTVRNSLCMIVCNNENTIGPCLESARRWVDEIVIVDTGSSDRTREICRQYGARIFEFPWCDDFSAARNESLKHARGEWIFWMDSDDTFPAECGPRLREIVEGECADNIVGYIMQVHCPGPERKGGRDMTIVDHLKLIRNRPDLRFEGRIHEQLLPAVRRRGGYVVWTDLYVVHSGADHSPAGRQKKLERDLRILHLELAEKPDHPFVLFNLGMTYGDEKQYGEAIDYLLRCLAVSQPEESHLRKAYALLVISLEQAGRHDEAWKYCQEGQKLYADDKELLFRAAMLHHHFGRLKEAEGAYLAVLNNSEQRHFTSIDPGLAGYKARHNLALVYEEMRDHRRAEEQWRKSVSERPDHASGWKGLAQDLLAQGRLEEVRQLGEQLKREPALAVTGFLIAARHALASGAPQHAHQELRAGVALAPQDTDILREECRFLFEHVDPAAAVGPLEALSGLEPDDASTHHNLAVAYLRKGRAAEAVAACRRALALRPDYAQTQTLLASALSASTPQQSQPMPLPTDGPNAGPAGAPAERVAVLGL